MSLLRCHFIQYDSTKLGTGTWHDLKYGTMLVAVRCASHLPCSATAASLRVIWKMHLQKLHATRPLEPGTSRPFFSLPLHWQRSFITLISQMNMLHYIDVQNTWVFCRHEVKVKYFVILVISLHQSSLYQGLTVFGFDCNTFAFVQPPSLFTAHNFLMLSGHHFPCAFAQWCLKKVPHIAFRHICPLVDAACFWQFFNQWPRKRKIHQTVHEFKLLHSLYDFICLQCAACVRSLCGEGTLFDRPFDKNSLFC